MPEFRPIKEGQHGPVEVWLTKKNIEVFCRVVFEDETDTQLDVDSLSMRGAQREMTAWLIGRGYEPAGRWVYDDDSEEESVRAFRPAKAGGHENDAVTTRPGDEDLDQYELWARDRLEPLLGPLHVIDRKGGSPGLHDFEADLPGGPVAAFEVTSEVESDRLSVASEIRRRGLSRYPEPGLNSLWSVRLTDDARVRDLSRRRDELRQILSDLEAQGARYAHNMSDYRNPVVQRLRDLGIGSVYRLSTGRGGGVVMGSDAYGGFGWDGPVIDAWLDGLLASSRGINKLEKLRRATAAERHLVIVLDSFSQAGMGIPLGLTDRDEPGAAAYVMPSLVPPEPLTHVWLLPTMARSEGLRWTHDGGWTVLPASAA